MKIEQGKYYRTRDGRKVGPVEGNQLPCDPWPWKSQVDGEFVAFDKEGKAVGSYLTDGMKPHLDLISEWTDEPDAPKTWGEMTDAEKGAIALAYVDGKEIEVHSTGMNVWGPHCVNGFHDNFAYRIKPETKRETVTLYGVIDAKNPYFEKKTSGYDYTHRITFETLDGEPDLSSIRMEAIND